MGSARQRIAEFMQAKADYLMAHGEEKRALRQKIADLRADLASWVVHTPGQIGFDWAVEFAEVFADGGFHIVVANPPYVRADAPYRHITDEAKRQEEIAKWQAYRSALKASGIYKNAS